MNALVYGSSLAAAFLGGILALFAPCCVVSLLPTFVAASLRQKRLRLIASTVVYAAGVAVVLLPLVLGIGALGQLLGRFHREVFAVVGLFLTGLGLYALSGRGFMLPLPMLRTRPGGRSGIGGVFALGVLSGMASSCCAPVLVGVVAMSALASSVFGALGLGLAYVFGMVFPLLVATLLWERLRLGQRQLFAGGSRGLRLRSWSVAWTDLLAGAMFLLMGTLSLFLAVTGQGTYTPDWLVRFNRWATGEAGNLALTLHGVPTAIQAVALLALAGTLAGAVYGAWRRPSRGGQAGETGDRG
jgi:cytochrome c biogenesis protein CcdA